MKTYVIADLHGRFDLLTQAFSAIYSRDGGGTIVFTGDYVDRGPQSFQIISYLKKGPSGTGWKWKRLQGNHEDMMIQCVTGVAPMSWWIGNGGDQTLASYPNRAIPDDHLKWLANLPLHYTDKHRIYVHAGVDPLLRLEDQEKETMLWYLYDKWDEGQPPLGTNLHVVHGHHQFANGPKLYKGRTDLDTFAWHTGRLVVGVFDDDTPGGPVDLIEIKGPTYDY